MSTATHDVQQALKTYLNENDDLIRRDRGFARWLAERYVPLAGGWQY
jgi:hypothetical protein